MFKDDSCFVSENISKYYEASHGFFLQHELLVLDNETVPMFCIYIVSLYFSCSGSKLAFYKCTTV